MQAARDLVGVAAVIGVVEFAACVKLGHDDLGRRDALFGVDVDGDAAAVVADGNAGIGVDLYGDGGGVACQSLVNAVVHHFVDHVVQARPIIGVADIHAGAFADRLQPLENLDGIGAVFGGFLRGFGHRSGIP